MINLQLVDVWTSVLFHFSHSFHLIVYYDIHL
ncbi:unnamed protein product [Schistosoma curassoni]|uniref:Uncharacterized protein n=1 Tax=Schistosoma curassoni TaxID=6186 RepID=A0A183L2H4_9TREM|nr:unnamed protein product [Schistosoma curassoni]